MNTPMSRRMGALIGGLLALFGPAGAMAAQPEPWQIDFQPAVTPIMEQIQDFNFLLSVIIIAISAFVMVLLGYVMFRFSVKRNPVPSRTSHNTVIEVIWTVVPIMILVLVAVPSFKLLYLEDRTPDADMTIKAIGHQWYWSYEYPDHDGISFDSLMVQDSELKDGEPRLLATDNDIVLPVDTTVRVLVTADDVLHAWAVPAFGVKIDAVPGRLNETWVRIQEEGTYYGQCSELCGVNHGFMPISVRAVSQEEFQRWVAQKQAELRKPAGGPQLADASASR